MSISKQFIMRMSLLFIVLTRLPSCVHEYLSTFNKKDGMWRGWAIAALRLLIKVVNYPYPLNSWWDSNIKALFLQLAAVRKQTFFFLGTLPYSASFQDRKLAQSPKVYMIMSCFCICLLLSADYSVIRARRNTLFNVLDLREGVIQVWCFIMQAIKCTALFPGRSIYLLTDFCIEPPSAT